MVGFLCIAMMREQPHFITVGVTEYEPDVWAETLLLPSHLLCYEGFYKPKEVEEQLIKALLAIGIEAKSGKSFKASPDEVLKVFLKIRDDVLHSNEQQKTVVIQTESEEYDTNDFLLDTFEVKSQGEQFYDHAKELPFASEKGYQLYQQSANMGYQRAYVALAHAYFNGWGVKRNVNTALRWMQRGLENVEQLHTHDLMELGELLHNLATEYENGSDQVIPDLKKAHQLNLQSAELGCELAYTPLACSYLSGQGVEKDLNAALEWATREMEANIIYGYNHATTCFIEAGMKAQAEQLWKRCFKEQPIGAIATTCLRVYKKQVLADSITIDPEIEMQFSNLADRLANYQREIGVSIYDEEILWLGVRDNCSVCHIPISPETARKTEGKCANCFINELP